MAVNVSRRHAVAMSLGVIAAVPVRVHAQSNPVATIWRNPTCGCCKAWARHLATNGIATTLNDTPDMQAVKTRLRVPADLASCHTAEIAGDVIEGHVPAAAILKLLANKSDAIGLAVPGMPIGSPGMEGGTPEFYDIILFGLDRRLNFGRWRGDRPA